MANPKVMSRDEMLERIGNGYSVFHEGRLIARPDQVPSDGEIEGTEGLAREIEAEAAALAEKKARYAAMMKAEREAKRKAEAETRAKSDE
jgi:hypothetical protein